MKSKYHLFFSNLANELRMDIILALRGSPLGVSEIAEKLNQEQSKVSHALTSLKSCNVVEAERDGKKMIYSLNKKTINPILDLIDAHAKTFCKGNCKGCKR